jgi:single-strand DNA-binding protein
MAGETTITVVGNATSDADLRFTPSGAAVANWTVASTPRFLDKASGEWKDGEPLFLRCSIWRDAAEHVAETITKGMRIIVVGRLKQRTYEKDGQKRTVVELECDEVGPALKYATATVTKAPSQSGGGFGSPGGSDAGPTSGPTRTTGFDDEPPF